MLNHQRQPDNVTCVPTSVAILAGVSVDVVLSATRDHFHALPGTPWDVLRRTYGGWGVTAWACSRFLGNKVGAAFFQHREIAEAEIHGSTVRRELKVNALPEGRGLLLIRNRKQWAVGHCVAYAGGLVYDPEQPVPLTLNAWRALPHLNEWVITEIIPQDPQEDK